VSLEFAREPLEKCWGYIYDAPDGLAYCHWMETQQHRHKQGYAPSFKRYQDYERMGCFLQFTARAEGRIVGYSGVYVVPSMHTQRLISTEDTWYLTPEYRKGWNAIKFYKWIEGYCKALGVEEATLTLPVTKDARLGHMLERLAYSPISVQYSKDLLRPDRADSKSPVEDANVLSVATPGP